MTHRAPIASRTVKPRKRTEKFLPILSYTPDTIYREIDDTYHSAENIFALVVTEQPSLIVAQGIAPLLRELHEKFHRDPLWQFYCSPIEQKRYLSNQQRSVVKRTDTMVTFLGFRGKPLPDGPRGGKRNESNRYHSTLDPVTFVRKGISELVAPGATVEQLYIWATQVRRFCLENGLSLRPTSGSLAGQLLRDKRFYPHARRKVPSATNARARNVLPGNYYRLLENEGTQFDAYYLDQISAHHNCAATIQFPHANGLKAHGHFRTLTDKVGLPARVLESGLGLYYVKLSVPHIPPGHFPPPWAIRPGEHTAYLFSNEIDTARKLGVRIQYIIAAWISNCRDRGLNRYAQWALEQLGDSDKAWKKPLLLSTYGILAAIPRTHRVGYAHSTSGSPALYPAGAGFLPVSEHTTTRPSEPGYANVIQRGMIEAETRLRSLGLATDLSQQGHRIAAVYADSVFVHARDLDGNNIALPIPPPGWQVEEVLTRLRFHNPVSFSSDQITKLPGVPSRDTVLRASFGTRHARRATILV